MEKLLSLKLDRIAAWQLKSENSNVELPPLQRSFVWNVNQIESLWDSIFRGYPIGSFMLSTSQNEKLFILDGQQRATSIALGYYNPWEKADEKFWSLKTIPVVWIDLNPKGSSNTQKFVFRVVTQSHPWGYNQLNSKTVLTVPERKKALELFNENPLNKGKNYVQFDLLDVFPFDCNLPVPLSFLIQSKSENILLWKETLISMCESKLPINYIKTRYSLTENKAYIDRLKEFLGNTDFVSLSAAINNVLDMEIPGIIVKKEILKAEDEKSNDVQDPTLFVRLNSAGTPIVGEELIYSIYKASFPEAKNLVENIGLNFIAPSLVISLVSRLAISRENEGAYPTSLNVNDFRKRIEDISFKKQLRELIGTSEKDSPAKNLFDLAFEILLSKEIFDVPPSLIKSVVKGSPEIFLMLLKWIELNNRQISSDERQGILAAVTAFVWFGRDNQRYVRENWKNIGLKNFWTKEVLSFPYFHKRDYIMYPLIQPSTLRKFLLLEVAENRVLWDKLYPENESEIAQAYRRILNTEMVEEIEVKNAIRDVWNNFRHRLFKNKSLILFAQRKYINDSFGEFNSFDTLIDTNTPWDWDHIYSSSFVNGKWNIHPNTRHWTNSIGNLRAMSLSENRSDSNTKFPQTRLANNVDDNIDNKKISYVKGNDWEYWSQITERINEGDAEMITIHLKAIINRMCNIYEEWYDKLEIGKLFDYE